jgi:PhzF family phenazine biosynthesis protein
MKKGSYQSRIPIYHVDAFTDEPFRGNPAAVCLLQHQYEDRFLQSIAAEMNLSETAFCYHLGEKPLKESRSFSLRWFTPKVEVPLCGHATLATAAVLFYEVNILTSEIAFETKSGRLIAKKEKNGILLDFPADESVPIDPDRNLLNAIRIADFENAEYAKKTMKLLIHLRSEKILKNLRPDFENMKSVRTKEDIRIVIVTSLGHPPYDFVSRCFAPWIGINEDPVTGAAHTLLAPYWSKISGKKEMLAYQASSRGGKLVVRVRSKGRVDLIGNAVIVSKGELYLP